MTTYYCLPLLAQVLATVLTLKRLANLRLLFVETSSLLPSVVPSLQLHLSTLYLTLLS